jgi:cell division initiation protein
MEISGKILREVEFRDRLRGYDTDEVDDFLEKVAIAVEELQEEVHAAQGRADRAERQAETLPPVDDDSLRRTLVLAQRTADLAINEAREEATRLVTEARQQADSMLTEARHSAQAMRNEAEREMQARVQRLGEEHDRLTKQIGSLTALVEGERARITESLSTLLGYVAETLNVSSDLAAGQQLPGLSRDLVDPAPNHGGFSDFLPPSSERSADDPLDLGLPDVEAEIGEDAAIAFGANRELDAGAGDPSELEPDEELWSRWASAEGEQERRDPSTESFRFGRNEGDNT